MGAFFSIVIPVYNVAPYLRECLDSILAQTFSGWEAICVDDGSTDGSGAILDEYESKDIRFKVIHQKNAGVSAARNAALKETKGGWIMFLDGDDAWSSILLSTVVSMINTHPREKLFRFDFTRFIGNDWTCSCEQRVSLRDVSILDISKEIAMHDFYDYFFSCYAYSKEILNGLCFPRYVRGEDRCFLAEIMLARVGAVVAIKAKLYGYRRRVGSATNSTPSLQVLCDEMDHRLDIMEMIDRSGKRVNYTGNQWLEKYMLVRLYNEVAPSKRRLIFEARLPRIARMRKIKHLSWYGRFIFNTISIFQLYWMDIMFCYYLPRLYSSIRKCGMNLTKIC